MANVLPTKVRKDLEAMGFEYLTVKAKGEWRWIQAKEQGNKCPLCLRDLLSMKPANVVADHDHRTHLMRGVLCSPCNQAIGMADRFNFMDQDWWLRVHKYMLQPNLPFIYPSKKPAAEVKSAKRRAQVNKLKKSGLRAKRNIK